MPWLISDTNAMYTTNPCTTPSLTETACALGPMVFSAMVEALAKLTYTCDPMAFAVKFRSGREPVMFGPTLVILLATPHKGLTLLGDGGTISNMDGLMLCKPAPHYLHITMTDWCTLTLTQFGINHLEFKDEHGGTIDLMRGDVSNYGAVYGLTMPSNGTMTIDGIKYHGQPGINLTPDDKVLSIENSTWYMINSTGSLSKIHFGAENNNHVVPWTRLLNGHVYHGITSFHAVTLNLYFGLCTNNYSICNNYSI
jgi:hypothetical protein